MRRGHYVNEMEKSYNQKIKDEIVTGGMDTRIHVLSCLRFFDSLIYIENKYLYSRFNSLYYQFY